MKKIFFWLLSVIILITLLNPISTMAESDDHTPPVLKSLNIKEQGENLYPGDTIHFSAQIEDESKIQSVYISIRPVSLRHNLHFSDYSIELTLNPLTGLYEGTYTLKNTNISGEYYCSDCSIYDVAQNYFSISDYDSADVRAPLEGISFIFNGPTTDTSGPEVKSLELLENGKKLYSGDTIHFKATLSDENEIQSANVSICPINKNSTGFVHRSIDLIYNSATKAYEGSYTFQNTDLAGEYCVDGVRTEDIIGNSQYIPKQFFSNISFTLIDASEDTNGPVINSFSIVEENKVFHSGDVINFRADVKDPSGVRYVDIGITASERLNQNNFPMEEIVLTYNKETGFFEGYKTVSNDEMIGEYFVHTLRAIDTIGNESMISVSLKNDTNHILDNATYTIQKSVPLKSLSLNQQSLILNEGENLNLTLQYEPENATQKEAKWKSSRPDVASVDENGNVTAINEGTTVISVISLLDPNISAQCTISVKPKEVKVTRITLSNTAKSLLVGSEIQLSATVEPINATNSAIKWSSSNPNVATVADDGTVKAVKTGTATITAMTQDGSEKFATCTINVLSTEKTGYIDDNKNSETQISGDPKDKNTLIDSIPDSIDQNASVDFILVTRHDVAKDFEEGAKKQVSLDHLYYAWAFDMGLFYSVNSGTRKAITETTVPITLKLYIPWMYRCPGRNYYIYRYHINDDGTTEIKKISTSQLGNYWENDYYITFQSDKFSAYFVAYEDAKSNSNYSRKSGNIIPKMKGSSSHMFPTPNASSTSLQKAVTAFIDVPSTSYYSAAVTWAVDNHITYGYSDGKFHPNDVCTRGQMIEFLYRLSGSPKTTGILPFNDVPQNAYYKDAILWAVQNGITSGKTSNTFAPNEPCNRGQMATFLWRMKGKPESSGSTFEDVKSTDYYSTAISWLKSSGITAGKTQTSFDPNGDCTRGQMVTFLYRYSGNK